MDVKLKLIAAASENLGIGKNGNLPWQLKKEMAYFNRMTTTTKSNDKKNVVIMGRKTWESIPKNFKPLKNRINVVLSRSDLDLSQYKDVYGFKSLNQAIENIKTNDFQELCEDVWIIGGSSLYKEGMCHPHFFRLYLTRIHKNFECDTFFPALPENMKRISYFPLPSNDEVQGNIDFFQQCYQKCQYFRSIFGTSTFPDSVLPVSACASTGKLYGRPEMFNLTLLVNQAYQKKCKKKMDCNTRSKFTNSFN